MGKHTSVANGWTCLAAAVLASGKRENDIAFLNSDWHDVLQDFIELYNEQERNKSALRSFSGRADEIY